MISRLENLRTVMSAHFGYQENSAASSETWFFAPVTTNLEPLRAVQVLGRRPSLLISGFDLPAVCYRSLSDFRYFRLDGICSTASLASSSIK